MKSTLLEKIRIELRAQLERLAKPLAKSGYGQYLLRLLTEKVF